MCLRASPLKIPSGALPLDPTNFLKKVRQKLFWLTSFGMISQVWAVKLKSFLSTFFKKVGRIVKGATLDAGFLRATALKLAFKQETAVVGNAFYHTAVTMLDHFHISTMIITATHSGMGVTAKKINIAFVYQLEKYLR